MGYPLLTPIKETTVVDFNLDEIRAAKAEALPSEYRTLQYAGREWHVLRSANIVKVLAFAEAGDDGQLRFFLDFIKDDEQEEFRAAMEADDLMDTELFQTMVEFLTGEVTGRPTEQSPDSAAGSQSTGAKLKGPSSPVAVTDA